MVYAGLREVCGTSIFRSNVALQIRYMYLRHEPIYIKINVNIKLINGNLTVMLSQTRSYDQFARFPKTVKSVAGLFASNNDLKTVTSSPAIKRVLSVTNV